MDTEIGHVKSYLAIEKARFGDKLEVEFNIDENVNCQIPPLILQPIVENAVKHGILPKRNGGKIIIGAVRENEGILLFVKDNGVGMGCVSKGNDPKGCGIGISNVHQRLINVYGEKYGLKIDSTHGEGTNISMVIPFCTRSVKIDYS